MPVEYNTFATSTLIVYRFEINNYFQEKPDDASICIIPMFYTTPTV